MVLIPPPRRSGGIEDHREITWERIAGEQPARLGHVAGDTLDHALLAAAQLDHVTIGVAHEH